MIIIALLRLSLYSTSPASYLSLFYISFQALDILNQALYTCENMTILLEICRVLKDNRNSIFFEININTANFFFKWDLKAFL